MLIALPDIFRGIGLNPLSPGNTSYLLWMFMGFLVVTAVLVVSFGRLGDMFGRVTDVQHGLRDLHRLLHPPDRDLDARRRPAALWLIIWRVVQGIGGAFLFANSTAILTDAFPANQRGMALGINSIAAIAGSFIGLILGGVLGPGQLAPDLPGLGARSACSAPSGRTSSCRTSASASPRRWTGGATSSSPSA